MTQTKLGVLHPGQMGISVAASAQKGGCQVYWVSEGRSPQTHERAAEFDLLDAGSLGGLCQTCSIIVSVCPPHAAEAVADQVLACGFRGLYVDANAISPGRVRRIGRNLAQAGVTFVDGGIVGGPAWQPGRTWLYLAGEAAQAVADCFSGGPLETEVVGDAPGPASALKMCYAAYTKGSTALLCAILATAETLGVRPALQKQWAREGSGLDELAVRRARRVTVKAWRFAGEMEEISTTFREAGLPGDFHAAAAEVYRRLADFKDAPSTPELGEVLAALLLVEAQERG